MARRVRVSALGLPNFMFPKETIDEELVLKVWGMIEKFLNQVMGDRPDFIVLNEICDRPGGLTVPEMLEYYKVRGNKILDKFREFARNNKVNLAYSSCLGDKYGDYRNATVFIGREGEIRGQYNKNYICIDEFEERGMLYGKEAPVIEMDFGTVGGIICFDLNFYELLSRYEKSRPELLVFSSMYHGGHVQSHWAYTCRSYFVGAVSNQRCTVINPLGIVEATSSNYFFHVSHDINLDYVVAHLDENWQKLDDMKAKYGRDVTVFDPGYIGAVIITSESDTISAMEMAKEFDIELLDHYFERSIASRYLPGRMEK